MSPSRPPLRATQLMQRAGVDPAIIGDLMEEHSKGRSRLWFWTQAIGALLSKGRSMSRYVVALRWVAALPLAIFAVRVVNQVVDSLYFGLLRGDFHHMPLLVYVACFLMAAAFVTTMVLVAPARRNSVARIAFGVVLTCSATPLALSVWSGDKSWTGPLIGGLCGILGGVAAYAFQRSRIHPLENSFADLRNS